MKTEVSIAEAKARFSELINLAAYGGERIVITKHGKPIAVLLASRGDGLGSVSGWMEEKDPFFKDVAEFETRRHQQELRKSGKRR